MKHIILEDERGRREEGIIAVFAITISPTIRPEGPRAWCGCGSTPRKIRVCCADNQATSRISSIEPSRVNHARGDGAIRVHDI